MVSHPRKRALWLPGGGVPHAFKQVSSSHRYRTFAPKDLLIRWMNRVWMIPGRAPTGMPVGVKLRARRNDLLSVLEIEVLSAYDDCQRQISARTGRRAAEPFG